MRSPRHLLTAWNLQAKKQLGQNFLTDASLAEKIVSHADIVPDDVVLEIGAGLGALTIPAARAARRVFAVETDRRLIGLLKAELLAHGITNVTVVEESILRLDWSFLEAASEDKLVVLGNLPYNISSQVLIALIRTRTRVDRALLMFQKELAERIRARPGGRDYGRLSVMVQYCAEVETVVTAAAEQFFPKPKVDSVVLRIRFNRRPDRDPQWDEHLFRVIKASFSKRRKTLKNALSQSALGLSSETARQALQSAGIDPSRRAETLSVSEFITLARAVESAVQ